METECASLWYDNESGESQCVSLVTDRPRLLIGRSKSCDIVIGWDNTMSREHAVLELMGEHWFLVDDGMSTHGTYVRSRRSAETLTETEIRGRRRLEADDRLLLGKTLFTFRTPDAWLGAPTRTGRLPTPELSNGQKRVLVALCRPLLDDPNAMPATNQQIADELSVGLAAVRDQLRVLFHKFDVEELRPMEKRIRLAKRALHSGCV